MSARGRRQRKVLTVNTDLKLMPLMNIIIALIVLPCRVSRGEGHRDQLPQDDASAAPRPKARRRSTSRCTCAATST
jgi:hypothetical protein